MARHTRSNVSPILESLLQLTIKKEEVGEAPKQPVQTLQSPHSDGHAVCSLKVFSDSFRSF